MNIAVILNDDLHKGGGFQYCLSMITFLERMKSKEYNFVFFTTVKQNTVILRKYNIKAFYLRWCNIDEFFSYFLSLQLLSNVLRKFKINISNKFERILRNHNIDLIYFLSPTSLSLAAADYNFVFTVWDLCFRSDMEFPEVYAKREFERREYFYNISLKKAIKIITESEITKNDIIRKYGIDEERIICLPFLPSEFTNISEAEYIADYIDIKNKYSIEGDYIFYPAQLWPHKNHIYILNGLKILKEKYRRIINVVFSGSDKGSLNFILKKAEDLGLLSQVHYIGFVDNKEMPYLYKQALALVMPTYLGPTNIPPLEAFRLGCPVLYSDLPKLKEQVKDAAVLLDLKDPESLCKGLLKVIEGSLEIKILIENGKRKIEGLVRKNYWLELKNVFDDYSLKLKCRK